MTSKGGERTQNPSGLGAHQFRRIGIALLRHDGGTRGELVRQFHEAELRGGPDDNFFGEPREMRGANGGGGEKFQNKVTVGHRIQ